MVGHLNERTILRHSFGGEGSGPWQYGLFNRHEVPRDPLSIGITIITAVEALTATSIGFSAASFVGSVAITAVVAGANYALNRSKADDGGVGYDGPSSINTPDARGSIRMATAPQRHVVGRTMVGGAWSFYDDATAPYQYLQVMLARGRISAVRSVIFNKQRVTFGGGTPFNTILSPLAVEGQDYAGNLLACFRQGLDSQAIDPLLTTYFPPSGSDFVFDATGKNIKNLPTSFRQQGVATASFRASFGSTREVFAARWGNVAYINPLIEVDGAPVYDPRDATQDMNDPSTWKFTRDGIDVGRTAALVQANWQIQPFGGRQPVDRIRWDEVAECATYDESIVHDIAGNPRPRHQIDGVVLLNENPRHATEAMLTANRAFIVQSRGRVGWVSSAPKEPVVTLTERDILGGFDFRADQPKKEIFNRIRTRFTPPEKEWKEDDGPVQDRPDLRSAEDDGELLDTTVRTPFTGDHRAVQWLSQQFLEDSRVPRTLDIPVIRAHPRFLKRKIGDVVRVQHAFFPDIDGIYQIVKDGFSRDFETIAWSLREYDRSISAADRAADEQPFQVAEAA